MTGLRKRIVMDGRNCKMTRAMRSVLAVVADAPETRPAWGLSVCESTGLGPGTVYPALDKLLKAGLIRAEPETPAPGNRPPRRFYRPSYSRTWYRASRLLPAGPEPEPGP